MGTLRIAGLVVIILMVGYFLARFEILGLESLIWGEAAATFHPTRESALNRIVIVAISQNEYDRDFGGQSPLNPAKLLADLINIAHAGPKLIVVDIDTSHHKYLRLSGGHAKASSRLDAEVTRWHDKFVWARPVASQGDAYVPKAVLGEDAPPGSRLWSESGATAFPIDPNRAVTTYLRQFITGRGRLDTLPYAAAIRVPADDRIEDLPPDDRKRLLRLWGGPLTLADRCVESSRPAGTFLACSMKDALAHPATLRNKIVIAGGVYRESNDFHETVNGKLPGIEIIADALETEASGGGPLLPSALDSLILAAIIGALLAFAYRVLGFWTGVGINLAASVALFLIFVYRPESSLGVLFPIPLVFLMLFGFSGLHEYHENTIRKLHRRLLRRAPERNSTT
ncbi:MAG TPA: CHASE2 domain-containing protein [Candidatus Binataceae bacterium]|nr:CHASE2 domain-containing protein [Candidatus Binataceae bacterium]